MEKKDKFFFLLLFLSFFSSSFFVHFQVPGGRYTVDI